jgi:L-cystine transport system permease protein
MAGIDLLYIVKSLKRIVGAVPYTLFIIVVSGVLSLCLAMGIALIRINRWKIIDPMLHVYVSFFRSTPPLIHIFLVYYGIPMIFLKMGVSLPEWSRTLYVILALVLFNGALMSEFLRPAYLSVDRGQHDAADSLGMTSWTKFCRVIFPQLLKVAWPNIENSIMEMAKDTSVLFVIGLVDVMGKVKVIIHNDYGVKKLEVYFAAAIIYWCIIFTLSKIFKFADKKKIHSGIILKT